MIFHDIPIYEIMMMNHISLLYSNYIPYMPLWMMRMSGLGQSESGGACHDLIDEKAVLLGAGWDVMENLHGTYGNDRQIIYKSSTNHLQII